MDGGLSRMHKWVMLGKDMFFHKKHLQPITTASVTHNEQPWMEAVLTNIGEGVCVILRDGTVMFANTAFAVLCHDSRDALLRQPVWKCMYLTSEDGQSLTASTIEKAWSVEGAHLLNGLYHYDDKTLDVRAQYITDINQMALVIRDISGAEEARNQAIETAEHLKLEQTKMLEVVAKNEAMLRSIGDAVIAIDKDARLILMNSSAERLFGVDASKLIGYPAVDALKFYDENGALVPPENRMLLKALQTGEGQGNEEEARSFYHRPNGTAIALALKITPIILKDDIIGAIGIYRDITHAREVDRMKTEFISLASHQLRTPLSAIKWFDEMLLSGDAGQLNNDQLDFAKHIAQSTDRMIQLVNALLNISRIESGGIIVEPKPTDLREVVQNVISDLRGLIDEKHQTLIVSVHDNLPKVMLDQRLIGQAYLNLLTNAIAYTPDNGEVTIIISADGKNIISQISDTGIGVPQAQQSKLFQKFFRAQNAVKVETDGNGLGLYLVRAIVESSGGKVWFKSEEGTGSSFWFSLPLTGMQAHGGEAMLDTGHNEQYKNPA